MALASIPAQNINRGISCASPDGKTLAVILSGEHAMELYRVGPAGHLKLQQTVTGIPEAAAGLVTK